MSFLSRLRQAFGESERRSRPAQRVFLSLECLEDRCLPSGTGFLQINLASDVPALAATLDPHLVNPWGMAYSPTGPFWFADTGTNVSDVLDGSGQPVAFLVAIPSVTGSSSEPTGTVFSAGDGFVISQDGASRPSRFLFATKEGTILGWAGLLDEDDAILAVDNSATGASYFGLALATNSAGHSHLYAADFARGQIDVFDEQFNEVVRPGAFEDPTLPSGYAPFNVQTINGEIYVTYAKQDESYAGRSEFGAGLGYVNVFDSEGTLLRRFASNGALNSPWGMALAPASFGPFGGALLIGNTGDGRINAYDPTNGVHLGALTDDNGTPIEIPGLWALTFGNGHMGGDANTLFFTAGIGYFQHGLFGAIQSPEQRGMSTAGDGIFDPNAPGEPDDYPLPPGNGPVLSDPDAALTSPTAVLLPASDSSLLLVPTLSVVSRSTGNSLAQDPSTAALLATTLASASDADASPVPRGDVASLNTLLDLRTSPTGQATYGRGASAAPANLYSVSLDEWLAGIASSQTANNPERESSNPQSEPEIAPRLVPSESELVLEPIAVPFGVATSFSSIATDAAAELAPKAATREVPKSEPGNSFDARIWLLAAGSAVLAAGAPLLLNYSVRQRRKHQPV